MEKEEFIKRLIQSNFINMIKNKDTRALAEFRNNPKAIQELVIAMGAGEQILESPAHLQMLEEIVKKVVEDLEEALEDTKAGCDYQVGFDEKDRLIAKIESFSTQDKYKLSISENEYNFESSYVRTGMGTGKRIIYGSAEKKQILDFEDQDNFDETINTGRKMLLDDYGFVIDELDAVKTTAYEKIPGSYEREKKVSKSGSHISRDGAKVSTRKSSIVSWNGDALHLNDTEEEKLAVYTNSIVNVIKCPKVQKYYEDTLGISFEKMLKEFEFQE